jgi:uncharacterized membrane protein
MLLPVAPLAASQQPPAPVWYALAFALYGVGRVVCHQLPERSFHLWSTQMAVCARCTGIYVGAAMAVIAVGLARREVRLKPDTAYAVLGLLALAASPNVATLVYEWTITDTPSNIVRAVAGAPLGAAVAFLVVLALR